MIRESDLSPVKAWDLLRDEEDDDEEEPKRNEEKGAPARM